ncbi:MAG: hypothetical protein CL923_09915 [Deltaproteobacteria bacterium]|jgi:hypothetical protein|nr:hypothetical protein [Deltaproteobacteria bacterium]
MGQVRVRPQRTKLDWALEMEEVLTTRMADAEKVILVCDNLDIHTRGPFTKPSLPSKPGCLSKVLSFTARPNLAVA